MFEAGIALKRQYGEDRVFDLSLGNPVVEPPSQFHRELLRLAEHPVKGMHRYMPNAGYPETREAVAASLRDETGIPFAAGHVVMTCGAAAALNVVLKTILGPRRRGGRVRALLRGVRLLRRQPRRRPGGGPLREGFPARPGGPGASINGRTRAVIINSPNNPSGAVYGEPLLKDLGELLTTKGREHGTEIFLISDEPYGASCTTGWCIPRCSPGTTRPSP